MASPHHAPSEWHPREVVHVAGGVDRDSVQRCALCRTVLLTADQALRAPYYGTGEHVVQLDGATWRAVRPSTCQRPAWT